jgi:hypothetical protein
MKLIHGVTTVSSKELKISYLEISERKESGDRLIIMEFNKFIKKKIFGNLPYSSLRIGLTYNLNYPDTPFGNQYVYKSNSQKSIVNLNNIELNKKMSLPIWPSRNQGFLRNNSPGSTYQTFKQSKQKNEKTVNFKSNRIYFNKTIISTWSPKKITKKQSTTFSNNDDYILNKRKDNQKKIKKLKEQIAKVLLPKVSVMKPISKQIIKLRGNTRSKTKKRTLKDTNDLHRSSFNEDFSKDNENEFFNFKANFLESLNFKDEINQHINTAKQISDKICINKQDIEFIIKKFLLTHEVYNKQYDYLMKKYTFYKNNISLVIKNTKLMDGLSNEYELVNNILTYTNDVTKLKEYRNHVLIDIERALIKEFKLIKFFRLEYDHEHHISNEKKLLKKSLDNIINSAQFITLSDSTKTKIIKFYKNQTEEDIQHLLA